MEELGVIDDIVPTLPDKKPINVGSIIPKTTMSAKKVHKSILQVNSFSNEIFKKEDENLRETFVPPG